MVELLVRWEWEAFKTRFALRCAPRAGMRCESTEEEEAG
jgi:hypothetical protein